MKKKRISLTLSVIVVFSIALFSCADMLNNMMNLNPPSDVAVKVKIVPNRKFVTLKDKENASCVYKVALGQYFTVPAADKIFDSEGYKFAYYSTSEKDGNDKDAIKYGEGAVFAPQSDITLYAHWNLIDYEINVHDSKGSAAEEYTGEISFKDYPAKYNVESEKITIEVPSCENNHFQFDQWGVYDPETGMYSYKQGFYSDEGLVKVEDTETLLQEGKCPVVLKNFILGSGDDGILNTQKIPFGKTSEYYAEVKAGNTDAVSFVIPEGSTGDINIIPVWRYYETVDTLPYVVKFFGGGGDFGNSENRTYDVLATAQSLIDPKPYTGCDFDGWYKSTDYKDDEKVEEIPAGCFEMAPLYAKWTPHVYHIYLTNYKTKEGEEPTTLTVDYTYFEDVDISSYVPYDNGNEFIGWYENGTANVITSFESGTYCKDIYATPVWKTEKPKITYYNSTPQGYNSIPYEYTPGKQETLVTPVIPDGYIFEGWYVTADFDSSDNIRITEIPADWKEDVIVYGKWTLIDYSITYELNGGNLKSGDSFVTRYNAESGDISIPEPERSGYIFAGWYDNPSYDGWSFNTINSLQYIADGGITVYAKWTAGTQKIIYNDYYGKGFAKEDGSYTTGIKTELEIPEVIVGYQFDGWYTTENLSNDENRVSYVDETWTGTVTLYAKWTAVTYTITYYNENGSVNTSLGPTTYTIESENFELPENKVTGKTFSGWKNKNGEDRIITSINKGSKGNIELIPVYNLVLIDVTYNQGTVIGNIIYNSIVYKYTIDDGMVALPEPECNGYTFGGWYLDSNCSGSKITEFNAADYPTGITVWAKWIPVEYKIIYDLNYDGASGIEPCTYTIETESVTLAVPPERKGYEFGGWYKEQDWMSGGYVEKFIPGENLIRKEITLYAKWTMNTYAITYVDELNGTYTKPNPDSYNVTDYEIVLENPVKAGYRFLGWYDSETENANRIEKINTLSATEITLYAKWQAEVYTIEYVTNGGSYVSGYEPVTEYNVNTDTVYLPKEENITKKGYEFSGWYTTDNFDNDAYRILNVPSSTLSSVVVYAKWIPRTYEIIYNNYGGPDTRTTRDYTYSETESYTLDVFERYGYDSVEWYASNALTGNTVTQIDAGHTGDVALYAKWIPTTYHIYYEIGSGATDNSGNPETYTIESDSITIASNITRKGYTFSHWENAEHNEVTVIDKGSTGDITLTAVWDEINYSITFITNGGSAVEPYNYSVELNENYVLPNYEDVSKAGYSFEGWYLNEDFSGDRYYSLQSGTSANYTFYAKWQAIINQINYENMEGAEFNDTSYSLSYTVEQLPLELPVNVTKTGYTFGGWFTSSEFEDGTEVTEIEEGACYTVYFYAKWIAVEYNITYNCKNGSFVSGGSEPPVSYTVENSIQLPDNIARTGYEFGGWYKDESYSGNRIDEITTGSTGDITLYAKWNIVNYDIVYQNVNLNGVTATGNNPTAYNVETVTFGLVEPERTGYTFMGWHKESEDGDTVTQIEKGSYGNLTLYAKWELKNYSISYSSLDVSEFEHENPANYNVEKGTITLTDALKEGYTFDGWYKTVDGTTAVTEIDLSSFGNSTSIELYARFVVNSGLTVTLPDITKPGTVVKTDKYTVEQEQALTVSLNNTYTSGYNIQWYLDGIQMSGGPSFTLSEAQTAGMGCRTYTLAVVVQKEGVVNSATIYITIVPAE